MEISASKTSINALMPIVERFRKFSSWKLLVKAIPLLQHAFHFKEQVVQRFMFLSNCQ